MKNSHEYTEDFGHFKITYCSSARSSISGPHFHEYYEIYYLISGNRYYFIDNKVYDVKSGDIVLINRNVIHKMVGINEKNYERACFYFYDIFLDQLPDNIRNINISDCFKENAAVIRLDDSQQYFMNSLVRKINTECLAKSDMYEAYLESLMVELLVFMKRAMTTNLTSKFELNDPKYKKFQQIIVYINENYMEELSLNLLSKKFYMSVSYLTKNFRIVTGFSLTEYLNHFRIKQSQSLLLHTNLSISQIAVKVGYNNSTHFSRAFKKVTGYSATIYRKLNKNN